VVQKDIGTWQKFKIAETQCKLFCKEIFLFDENSKMNSSFHLKETLKYKEIKYEWTGQKLLDFTSSPAFHYLLLLGHLQEIFQLKTLAWEGGGKKKQNKKNPWRHRGLRESCRSSSLGCLQRQTPMKEGSSSGIYGIEKLDKIHSTLCSEAQQIWEYNKYSKTSSGSIWSIGCIETYFPFM